MIFFCVENKPPRLGKRVGWEERDHVYRAMFSSIPREAQHRYLKYAASQFHLPMLGFAQQQSQII